jgi:four helix bundle protein
MKLTRWVASLDEQRFPLRQTLEGFRKRSDRDKIRFYNTSQGSLEECRYYLLLSTDLGYGDNQVLYLLLEETSRLLTAYLRVLEQNSES